MYKILSFTHSIRHFRPAFFVNLEKLGINKSNIANIEEREIIRIEKKLKIQSKSNKGYGNDYNDKIISALHNHLRAIQCFYENDLLYCLISGKYFEKDQFIPFWPDDKNDLIKVRAFFDAVIADDLIEQFKMAFDENRFAHILRWHYSANIFSDGFRSEVREIIKQKIDLIDEHFKSRIELEYSVANITYAKNKLFHDLLHLYADSELDGKIMSILKFCLEHKSYFKGNDLTNSLFHQLARYPSKLPEHSWQVMITGYKAGGSYRFSVKAMLVVILIFCFVAFYSYNRKPQAFEMPNNPEQYNHYKALFNDNRQVKEKYISSWKAFSCDSLFFEYNNMSVHASQIGLKKREPTIYKLKTGQYLRKLSDFNQPLPESLDKFCFVNNQPNPVVLLLYFSVCTYGKSLELYPCKYPFAWNEIYIAPNDSIYLSSDVLDYFSVKTGKELYRLFKLVNYQQILSEDFDYQWCNETSEDINLYKHTFVIKDKLRMKNAKIILTKNRQSYNINWFGPDKTLYNNYTSQYLKPTQLHKSVKSN